MRNNHDLLTQGKSFPPFIKNIRWGVATNSSSTHSIIFSPELISSGERDELINLDGEYGWDFFTAASKEAKEDYLTSVLLSNIPLNYVEIFIELFSDADFKDAASFIRYRSIDHQSKIFLPKLVTSNIVNYPFFSDYKKYLVENDFLILGGNDNTDNDHHLLKFDTGSKPAFNELFKSNDVAFWNGNYWVVINSDRKLRLKFDEGELIPEYPELIDFKITNYCDRGCEYCYQGSTIEGQHAPLDEIKKMVGNLIPWGVVTEFAIGGGEPVQHPNFSEILDILGSRNEKAAILNFTTRIPASSWEPKLIKTVQEKVTGIAYSVETSEDVEMFFKDHINCINNSEFLADPKARAVKMYIHLIPELMDDDEFRNILSHIEKINKDEMKGYIWNIPVISVTLLGLKTVGRAENIERSPRPEIVDIFHMMEFTPIGIDTKFALDYQEYLDVKGVDRKLYTTQEGEFSMYIDAVERKAYKSSYELNKPVNIMQPGYGGKMRYMPTPTIFKLIKQEDEKNE